MSGLDVRPLRLPPVHSRLSSTMPPRPSPPPIAIGHLDTDCFYVSAKRVRNCFLLKKPVRVLGNQGACIIAKSYEMKAACVQTGEPIWETLGKCPEGIYVKRDFKWYEVLSHRTLDIVQDLSPKFGYYSSTPRWPPRLVSSTLWRRTHA